MRMRTTPLLAAFALAAAFAADGVAATQVERQRAENERWRQAAEERQEEYHRKAREFEGKGELARALAYYRRVMSVYYPQWEIGRMGRGGDEDAPEVAARRRRRFHLRGSRYDAAARRIEHLRTRRIEATLQSVEDMAREARRDSEFVREFNLYRRLLEMAERVRESDQSAERYAARARSRLEAIEREALRALAVVERRLQSERTHEQAIEEFLQFEERYGPFEQVPEVNQKYSELAENPILARHRGAVEAGLHLDRALDYYENERFAFAYYEFLLINEQFPETDLAEEANQRAEEMEADPQLFRAIHATPRERYARELLRRASELDEDGDLNGSRRLYSHIASHFADCVAARHAQSRLNVLERLTD